MLLLSFILIIIVVPLCLSSTSCLFVCFRIACWPFVGKVLSFWLSACDLLLYAVLIDCVPFPFGVFVSVSVPDHCLTTTFHFTKIDPRGRDKGFDIPSI